MISVFGLIGFASGVLVLWSAVGWWTYSIPGWMAVITGICCGMYARRHPIWTHGGQTSFLKFVTLVLGCWGLILAGRFACAVGGMNHNEVWKTFRNATDDDGIETLVGDIRMERNDAGKSLKSGDQQPLSHEAQSAADFEIARSRWKSMNASEKEAVLKKWRVRVDWVADVAQSSVIQQAITQAYSGPNLIWHISGIVIALCLACFKVRT